MKKNSEKKIYILTLGATFMFSNAGTFLQHWALRKTLYKMGHMPVRVALPGDCVHIAINNFSWIISFVKRIVLVFLHYIGFSKYAKQETLNIKSFRNYIQARKFRKDYISNIGECIEDTGVQADVLILGGDQVFTNEFKYLTEILASKIISFAASTDWIKNAELKNWRDEVKQKLQYLSKVGVREQAGIKVLKDFEIESTKVADPVMLMNYEDLMSLAGKKQIFRTPTLFVYLLNISSNKGLHIEELSLISDELECDLRMHGIQGAQCFIPSKYYLSLGPTEFVRAIKDAKYLITNSYHGTVVALMLHKPFVSVTQDNAGVITQNIRQKELLDLVGLEHHRINMNEISIKAQSLLKENIEWKKIDEILEEYKLFSLNWLKEAIEN